MSDEGEFYPAQTIVNCDFCDTDVNVSWVCHTCEVSICQRCKEVHLGKKKFKGHKIRSRGEERLEMTIKTTKCNIHSSVDCTAYCEGCKLLACIKCVVDDHKDHNIRELKEAFDECRSRLKSVKDKYQTQKLKQAEDRRKRLLIEKERLDTNATTALNHLREERANVILTVNEVYDKLEKDVTQAQENQQNKIDKSLKSLQESEDVIEKILKECEKHEVSRDISIFTFVSECPEPVELSLGEVCINEIKVVPGSITSSYIEERASRVKSDLRSETESEILPSHPNARDVDTRILHSFMAPLSNKMYEGAYVIQFDKSDEVWMSNIYSSDLHLYNSLGSKVTSISTGFEIYGFEMDRNGDFIATDFDHKSVKKISQKGKVATLISSLPSKPCGVCLNHKQEIVLSLAGTNALSVYSPDGGRLVCEIGKGGGLFRKPYRLTQNSNHDYCVADDYKKVVIVDVHGSNRRTYDGQQGEEFNPNSIACDSYRCLVISDHRNHKIHIVDKDGSLIQVLLTKDRGIEFPKGLCVDKDGRLWIGQQDGKVHVVKYRSENT